MRLTLSAGPTSETIIAMASVGDKVVWLEEYSPETPLSDVIRDYHAFKRLQEPLFV